MIPRPLGPRRRPNQERPLPEGHSDPPPWPRNARRQDAPARPQQKVLYRQTDSLAEDRPLPHHQAHPYPAVLIDGLQPLHGYIPDVASPEEDFAWKRDACEPGDSGESCHGTPASCPLIPLSLGFSAWQLAPECHHLCPVKKTREEQSPLLGGRRRPRLRAQDLWGTGAASEAAILAKSPCLGLMAGSMAWRGRGSRVTSQINTKDGPTHTLCFVLRPFPP